ncbi:DNA repair protein RadA [Pseudactinotalea sp.]|uniref:DNA repair protein RadA n=1 Tax=Pseudactinotalea sp. TaxID=1926260 RepID=UPI003B3B9086
MSAKTAAKTAKPGFVCSECGWTATKWVGRCGECQAWGTLVEAGAEPTGPRTAATRPGAAAQAIADVDAQAAAYRPTGVGEFDRVLGGGIVPGAVVLLAGEPGVGKSTLLLDVAARAADGGAKVLYVTGEESAAQVRLRAERIDALRPGLLLAAETDLGQVLGHIEAQQPDLLVVDSVQTIASAQVDGSAGGVSQVREVASALISVAKRTALPVVLVGHVTKDGAIAGPRVLEHLVDVVCQFEGDKHAQLRMVRAVKNRFGSVDEVGCFSLDERGIHGLPDPSGLFLSGGREPVAGSCVTVTLDGRRPMPIEVQALLAKTSAPQPRRATHGMDSSRVAMALAVLSARLGLDASGHDTYVSTVGGSRAQEPAVDLAIALAVVSSRRDEPLGNGLVAVGEIGLAGELRPVVGTARRLAEARRLGFTYAIVPAGSDLIGGPAAGMSVTQAPDLRSAVEAALGASRP